MVFSSDIFRLGQIGFIVEFPHSVIEMRVRDPVINIIVSEENLEHGKLSVNHFLNLVINVLQAKVYSLLNNSHLTVVIIEVNLFIFIFQNYHVLESNLRIWVFHKCLKSIRFLIFQD